MLGGFGAAKDADADVKTLLKILKQKSKLL